MQGVLVELELGHKELSDTFGVRTHLYKSWICIQLAIPKESGIIRAGQLSMATVSPCFAFIMVLQQRGASSSSELLGADSRQFSAAEPAADTLLVTDHG